MRPRFEDARVHYYRRNRGLTACSLGSKAADLARERERRFSHEGGQVYASGEVRMSAGDNPHIDQAAYERELRKTESARDRLVRGLAHGRHYLKMYEEIPTGILGVCMIRDKLRDGEKALETGHDPRMKDAADELFKIE